MSFRRCVHATLYLTNSKDDATGLTTELPHQLTEAALPELTLHHTPMPEETHATIHHPSALRAFRTGFAPDTKNGL